MLFNFGFFQSKKKPVGSLKVKYWLPDFTENSTGYRPSGSAAVSSLSIVTSSPGVLESATVPLDGNAQIDNPHSIVLYIAAPYGFYFYIFTFFYSYS